MYQEFAGDKVLAFPPFRLSNRIGRGIQSCVESSRVSLILMGKRGMGKTYMMVLIYLVC